MADSFNRAAEADKYKRFDQRLMVVIGLVSIALIAGAVWMARDKRARWDAFAAAHECKVVSKVKGGVDVGTGVVVTTAGAVGTVVTTDVAPDKTAYRCNDGVTYWR